VKAEFHQTIRAGVLLALAALIGTFILNAAEHHSAPYIEANQRQALLDNLSMVVPADGFDNDILGDVLELGDPELLGMSTPTRIYRARQQGNIRYIAFEITAPDGYSGQISLLMGVRADGAISGVRVLRHRETPGLGDAIEARRSNWILGFDGKSLFNPGSIGWAVKKDGGEFDQFTGATITPRAVVKAVHNGLLFVERHRSELFADSETTSKG
jgi:Na+-translocating ferredoxin:NAD+ oxidoreductase subunit G